MVLGAAAAILVVGLAVGLGVALGSGSSSSPSTPSRTVGSLVGALPGADGVQRLLHGIPQHGQVLGSPSAPVTMVEYVDPQCPYCQQFETTVAPGVIARYVRRGKLRIVMRPIAFIGPDSERGLLAGLAAAEQNKLFNFMQILYLNQGAENTGWLSDDMVEQAAASVPGVNVPELLDARSSDAVKSQARKIASEAQEAGVTQTPTLVVGKTGQPGTTLPSYDQATVVAAIQKALA